MLYCLPVTFNLTIGFLTGRRLRGGKKSTFTDLDPRSQALHVSRLKMRQKIAKMVVCLVLLFTVSWLPLYFADLWIDCGQRPPSWLLQARPFAQWLGLTNSSLNPICYCFIGDLYRSAKVIRTRYYQKVAALFGTSSFSSSARVSSPITVITDTKAAAAAAEHPHIAAAAVAASASIVTIPRLLSLATGQALGRKVVDDSESQAGSDHSISDWCRSSPSVCDGSPFPFQLHTLQHPPQSLPLRRHSVNDNAGLFPLITKSAEIDMLHLRRHSGDRICGATADKRGIITLGRDAFCSTGQHRSKTSQRYSRGGDIAEDKTDLTSLWYLHTDWHISREKFYLNQKLHKASDLQFAVDSGRILFAKAIVFLKATLTWSVSVYELLSNSPLISKVQNWETVFAATRQAEVGRSPAEEECYFSHRQDSQLSVGWVNCIRAPSHARYTISDTFASCACAWHLPTHQNVTLLDSFI